MKKLVTLFAVLFTVINTCAMEIEISINGKKFAAEVEDTEAGRAFCAMLPVTLNMSELNGNEKYHYLDNSLPTDARYCSTINAGDLMLYGSSCVVLFYGNAGGYSYTRLGRLTSTDGLAEAVGRGSVNVTFAVKQAVITDIHDVNTVGDDSIYDLYGRRLDEEPDKGIFIKNGKKIVK